MDMYERHNREDSWWVPHFYRGGQPPLVLTDDTHALVPVEHFPRIPVYSHSEPSGCYIGKVWVRDRIRDGEPCRYLGSYEPSPRGPEYVQTVYRELLVV